MRAFLSKSFNGSLMAGCETSERLIRKLAPGEAVEVEWKTRNTRSVKWHKRYFALCNMIYDSLEGVMLPNGDWIEFTSTDVVHMTLKGLAGLYDAMITLPDGTRIGLIKSIAFDNMTADEWAKSWARILDAVHKYILPKVEIRDVEEEIARLAA
jgi:hypothetical protein